MGRKNILLRDRKSVPYSESRLTAEFDQFIRQKLLPRIQFSGKKLAEKERHAVHMLHNLVETGLKGECVADSRRQSSPNASLRKQVWDAIISKGFADWYPGSESSRKVTRYGATSKLLAMRQQWKLRFLVDVNLQRNTLLDEPSDHSLVVIKSGDIDLATGRLLPPSERRKPISLIEEVQRTAQRDEHGTPYPEAIKNGMGHWRNREDTIDRINRSQLKHTWVATVISPDTGRPIACPVNPCLRQVHVGEAFRAMRLYSFGKLSGQNFSKAIRKTILIDGEPVTELDFSGMAPRMLYHWALLDPNPKLDIYRPKRIFPRYYAKASKAAKADVRDFVKRLTNICLNVKGRAKANSAASHLLKSRPDKDRLWSAMRADGYSRVAQVIDAIVEVHDRRVVASFFTEKGVELMTTDGMIMLQILWAFAEADKPALGIHDAVLCKRSDAKFARKVMRDVYWKFMLREPVIKPSF